MRHVVYPEEPHLQSHASGVLLRRHYRKEQVREWLEFRELFLDLQLEQHGVLKCHYCHTPDLQKDFPEHLRNSNSRFLATIDHVHPVSRGGPRYDESNLVVACYPCNQNKADSILLP